MEEQTSPSSISPLGPIMVVLLGLGLAWLEAGLNEKAVVPDASNVSLTETETELSRTVTVAAPMTRVQVAQDDIQGPGVPVPRPRPF
jgi:hypothetical protein